MLVLFMLLVLFLISRRSSGHGLPYVKSCAFSRDFRSCTVLADHLILTSDNVDFNWQGLMAVRLILCIKHYSH